MANIVHGIFGQEKIFNLIPLYFRERTLCYIETHINTPNAAEAWILLSMIAPKIKSKNPEVVVTELIKNLQSTVVSIVKI